MKKFLILSILSFMLPAILSAQVKGVTFTAKTDKGIIFVGGKIRLTLHLEGDNVEYNKPFEPPELGPYFRLVNISGPETSKNMQFINGKMSSSSSISIHYIYEARQAGEVLIPAIKYEINKISVSTKPIKIIIKDLEKAVELSGDTSWSPPTDPYLEIKLDRDNVYLGQRIMAKLYFYTKLNINEFRKESTPHTLSDFSMKDLGYPNVFKTEEVLIKGEVWRKTYIKSYVLYPNKSGKLIVDSLPVYFYYSQRFYKERYVVNSAPVQVLVKDLPQEGVPVGFQGAVGRFKVQVLPDKGEIKTNEQFKFNITVQGTGHADFITKPEIDLPEDFDIYTEDMKKTTMVGKNEALGQRVYTMILVPHEAGDYALGPFTLDYFDPVLGKYKTAKSGPIRMKVTPGKKAAEPEDVSGLPVEKRLVTAVGDDLRFIKPDRQALISQSGWVFYRPYMIPVQFLPVLMIIAAFGVRWRINKISSDGAYARRLRSGKTSKKELDNAIQAVKKGQLTESYSNVYRALAGFIADYFGLPEQGVTVFRRC